MRVLVTGCAGFIGGHLARDLAAQGFDVHALYRRAPAAAETRANFTPVVGKFEAPASLPRAVEAVIHFGATSPGAGVADDQFFADNVTGTRAAIDYALGAGAQCFVFASSLSVYGRIAAPVVDEDTPCDRPDLYGETKLRGEAMLRDAAGRLPGLAIRLPGVLGRGARRNFLSEALARFRRNQTVVAFNPDARFNNAAHVTDLGRLIGGVVRRRLSGFEAITVGARGETTISAALARLRDRSGSRSEIDYQPSDRRSFTVSSARAIARHGYDPMTIGDLLDRYVDDELGD
jgi:UDP-glucose 4-epimerase